MRSAHMAFGLILLSGTPGVQGLSLLGSEGPLSGSPDPAAAGPLGPYVDPILLESFDRNDRQVAILVVAVGTFSNVRQDLERLGVEYRIYDQLHMFAVVLTREQLQAVRRIDGVEIVYRNEFMEPYLDKAAPYTGATVVWNTYKVRGRGVTVFVVDTGVDGTHPDVRYRENLIENVVATRQSNQLVGGSREGVPATDADGHGTHVASIVGGTAKGGVDGSDAGRYRGIAPEAKLVGYQAGIQDPQSGEVSFESTTVLEAFNYALAKRGIFNLSIVTNSWGANGEFEPSSPINVATLELYRAGLLVLFAAGNEGAQGEHTLNRYSVAPWVLGVGAGDYFNAVARFSSRGSDPGESGLPYDHPDVIAPGVGITAAKAATTQPFGAVDPLRSSTGAAYGTKSGTSMATPHVAGIASLLLSANPDLSPDDLMDVLTATTTPVPSSPVWRSGAGYVNAIAAYRLAVETEGSRDAFLDGAVKYAGPMSGDPKYATDAVTGGYGSRLERRLVSGDQSLEDFTRGLTGTLQGWIFLVGMVLLTFLAYQLRRKRKGSLVGTAPWRSDRFRAERRPADAPVRPIR